MHKKAQGFTLIELVVVIVILGILSAAALPKFIDLTDEAEAASVKALKGALETGFNQVYAKAVIAGLDTGVETLTINGGDIELLNGYPRVASSCSLFNSGISYWMDLDLDYSICSGNNDTWYGTASSIYFYIMPADYTGSSDNCYVMYTSGVDQSTREAVAASATAVTSGCGD